MICYRPDRGPKLDIVYGPPSASRRHGIRSNRQVGAREFPAEELLPGIQQLLRLGERLAVDILCRHDVSMVFPSAGQRFRQPRHLTHVAHTVRRIDVAHLVVDVAAIVVSTRSPDIGTAASSFL